MAITHAKKKGAMGRPKREEMRLSTGSTIRVRRARGHTRIVIMEWGGGHIPAL